MRSFGDYVSAGDGVTASAAETRRQSVFRRALGPVEAASQVTHVVELARRLGVSEARSTFRMRRRRGLPAFRTQRPDDAA
jgi:hypothetical protein